MNDRIEAYLKRVSSPSPHGPTPSTAPTIAVVIPALAERDTLPSTLDSLADNPAAMREKTIVIVVVNNRTAEFARPEDIAANHETLAWLDDTTSLGTRAYRDELTVQWIDAATHCNELAAKHGVGMARKLGMDLATRLMRDTPRAPIVSLDADTRVDKNYLAAIDAHFQQPDAWGAVLPYAHDLPVDDPPRRTAIVLYELFLRYYRLGLMFAGSPYAFHTIGSAMAASVHAYVTIGGMNQKQAAEDFYFLQSLQKSGRVHYLHGTTVHPSARVSHRVPFGTGAYVTRDLDGEDTKAIAWHHDGFVALRALLAVAGHHCAEEPEKLPAAIINAIEAADLQDTTRAFLHRLDFEDAWKRICENSRTTQQRRAQFHGWFDALKTLQLLRAFADGPRPPIAWHDALTGLFDVAQWPQGDCRDAELALEILRERDS